MLTDDELYQFCAKLQAQAENVSWNRLYNFLTYNSILVLAWATIYATSFNRICEVLTALISINVLGIIGGVFWGILGKRGRKIVDVHFEQAKELEPQRINPALCKNMHPFSRANEFREKDKWASSTNICHYAPFAFSVLHAIFLIAVL